MTKTIAVAALGIALFSGILYANDMAAGEELFISNCAICHGADTSGNTGIGKTLKIPDLRSPEVQQLSDAELKNIISNGKGKMPAWEDSLTATQIDQLVAFIRLAPKLAFTQKPPTAAESTSVSGQAPSEASQYAGAKACKICHDDIYKNFERSPHWKTLLDTRGGESKQGCEACHGPGQEHIQGGGDKTKIFSFKSASAKAVNERCLECHASGKDHANFSRSAHSENNLSCLTCHSPHQGMTNQFLLIKAQPELCYTCHLKMKAQFNMPFHHRVEEGLVQCADCHNPHGGFIGKQLRSAAARDTVCFACHADKQGPFVFEHPAIKVEGCEACHSPHGSPNPRLLKISNLNILCLRCHTASSFSTASGTPDFHNQAAQYQACVICHVAIHGSNFDRHFLK